ncbi:claspin isoform X2 [Rhincodon typus]|uniref:claspin isoform X2 n=1 Tax=Rhincodon typus TaxID=259920 RepID=UPI00202EB215|nr:claspin isoform X2 [Rhincodon typus]
MSVSELQPCTELTFGEEKTNDSDNDSGKGSYGMVSPHSNKEMCHDGGDSEEEIFTSKKIRRKPLQESDSDGEASDLHRNSNSKPEFDNENEERNLNVDAGDKSKRLRRIRRVMLDSDESDLDIINGEDQVRIIKSSCVGRENEEQPATEPRHENSDSDSSTVSLQTSERSKHHKERVNRKDKSQRQRERAQKKLEAFEKLQRKKKQPEKMEESTEYKTADDSGCLLNNSDLFETEMGDMNELDAEEELSLDAIRATIKKKAKQSKRMNLVPSGENLQDYDYAEALQVEEKKVRIERKAAKQSKEAIRQIHSETQRLMREASLSLPYHLPQPKTIHDFFMKRPRPAFQGNAMSLIKSAKYQSCLLQGTSKIPTEIESINAVPQDHGLVDQSCNNENVTAADISAVEESNLTRSNNKENICPNPPECEIQMEKHNGPVEIIEQSDISTDLESNGKDSVNAERSTEPDSYSFCLELTDETGSSDGQTILPENPHGKVDKIVPDSVLKLSSEVPRDKEELHKQLKTTSMAKQRKCKLDKLRVLGVDLTLKPRLCADEGAFVNLEEPKENKELQALKERFLKHSIKPVKQNQERRVELNTIRKMTDANGKEELKADSVVVTLGTKEVEEFGPAKPGEKLQVLKAKLQEAMKLRRVEERQKRQALYQLDNEQGFENEEDEEEELTESEEDDHETVEFLLGDEDAGVEADNDTQSTETAQNQDILTQKASTPTPKPIALEFSQALNADTAPSCKISEQTTGNKLRLQLQQSPPKGDSKLDEDDSTSQASTTKENSHNSSFELIGSMIPSYQPCNKQPGRFGVAMLGGFRSPSPNLFNPNSQIRTSFISSASKSSGKLSEPSMPVEDSQDLYNTSPEPKNSTGESQFRFCLEDETQSQLLDSDGFLNVGHRINKWQLSKRQLLLDSMDENAMDANMGELLGYCSGEFKSQNPDTPKEKSKEKEQNFDELLELCSGKFLSPESSSSITSAAKEQKTVTTASDDLMTEVLALCSGSFPTDKEEDEENEDGQFQLLTDDEVFESEDEKSVEEEDDEKVDDEEQQMAREVLMKRKLKLKDFVEDEAELSGSEVASDDEYDAESDDYEEDVIEEDLPSDEELQEQVNKIHMKVLMDEDKRKLRLYQEHYLADGDLHSDGPGRARKFRWKNIDDSSQTDLFRGDSEDEPDEEEVDQAEVKWRKDRFEREQWFRKQSQDAGSEEEVGEDSQFMKLAKKITVKTLQKGISTEVVSEKKQQESAGLKPQKSSSVLRMRNGSLLNQPREVLQKLATLSDVNLNAPRANSRKFVFHTLSPEKDEKKLMTESKPQMKRKAAATPISSLAKRSRTEKTPTKNAHTRSIFRYLEK